MVAQSGSAPGSGGRLFCACRQSQNDPQSPQGGIGQNDLTAVKPHRIPDNRQPQAAPRFGFIEPLAPYKSILAYFRIQARTIVVDSQPQHLILSGHMDNNAFFCPFPCVINDIPQYFLQVAAFAMKSQGTVFFRFHNDIASRVNAQQGAP